MTLKRLSLILLALFSININSMEEQNDEKSSEEKSNEQAFIVKSLEAKKLKFLCARKILKDNISTKNLPDDLNDYLKHFEKHDVLEKHNLAPVFKKYLIQCFDYLSLEDFKDILQIIDKANEISEPKSMLVQRMIPLIGKTVFCNNPLILLIGFASATFPNSFDINNLKIFEKINLENDDLPIKERYLFATLELAQSAVVPLESPCLKFIISSAKQGYAPSLCRLATIKATNNGIIFAIPYIKKLIEINALNDACELINFTITFTRSGPFSSELEFLEREDFCNCLNDFIKMILDVNIYKSDYDFTLALIYNYLNDEDKAKKHAEKCLGDNEGLAAELLFIILRDIYEREGNIEEEEFYSNKIKEIQDLENS